MYGPNPQGQQILDANGRYSLIIMRSDIPKFASNNRVEGTPEENKAVVQGSIAFFGTYTVDESAKTLTQHVESCSFPNFNGTDRKKIISRHLWGMNSTSRLSLRRPPVELLTWSGSAPNRRIAAFIVAGPFEPKRTFFARKVTV
jgi:hypothetical protein